ncbi:MAG: L-threonylcarbamoyladenylate synthase [Gammaproteobacteria bacterium]|uniref:L-threonylcarbamoyladenylate synthase n=1 Tax=hydrothermal vent metagenome TaxID=652676 RepID=A0A1W1E1E5_9ZZZZ|nr:L-threonylcarbamoyladenylate synthase [Gammaproteobacteria bacterium]
MNFQTRLTAKILNLGGVISMPTDTIQGLTCLPAYEQSMQKLLQLKHRNSAKGLILLASNINFLLPYVQEPSLLTRIKPQQQPTTYLLKANSNISPLITGEFDTVAVRITNNPLITTLCQQCNSALLSTSANITGKQTANTALKLTVYFKQQLDFILTPQNDNNQASQIIDGQTGKQLR